MEISSLELLLHSITSIFRLASCESIKYDPAQKYYQRISEILKLFKPIFDAIVHTEISSHEMLQNEFKGLTKAVDELSDLFENWQPFMSKIYFVLEVESIMTKVHIHGLESLDLLKLSVHSLPDEIDAAYVEDFAQKIKHMESEQTSSIIMKCIQHMEGSDTGSQSLAELADRVSLRSNQELLMEAIDLEKLREIAEQSENACEAKYIDQLIALVTLMHELVVMMKQSQACKPVPSEFFCPLSLELMADPVIVASGQTYERAFIQKWIDLGVTACPNTRKTLVHNNLIPNYTLKALIQNWCEQNNVKLPCPAKYMTSNRLSFLLENAESRPPTKPPANLSTAEREPDIPSMRTHGQIFWRRPSESLDPGEISSPAVEMRPDLLEVETRVRQLVEDLKSSSMDEQRSATAEIRLLAKLNMENCRAIARYGAIGLLVNLLHSPDLTVQSNAVTALLNLSISDINKSAIANAGAIDPLIHVLENGSPEAKANSAATLFSLSLIEENKIKIGAQEAIKPLVDLLENGTPRGKKDAAAALFNLSLNPENKSRIVQAGAVKYLVDLLDPAFGMVEKVVAVLSNLAKIHEGRAAIGQEGGIPMLVDVVELGSKRSKENAAAALLQLCTTSIKFCSIVLQEGAVPPLVVLSQTGTPRAREKAQQLLSCLRNQCHIYNGRP